LDSYAARRSFASAELVTAWTAVPYDYHKKRKEMGITKVKERINTFSSKKAGDMFVLGTGVAGVDPD
jgi:hypothetical protein